MNKQLTILSMFLAATFCCQAQVKEFDPMKDTSVVIIQQPKNEWNSCFMWYPGQLAAYYQQQSARISKERCVNVGYPGKFFARNNHAYFKKDVKLNKATLIQMVSPSTTTIFVNGEEHNLEKFQIMLPAGKSSLLIEVVTADSLLPCVMLKGAGLENPNEWLVSMDKNYWTIPESDSRYNDPNIFPDAPQEIIARIKPASIFPIRNAEIKGSDNVRIGKNGYVIVDFHHLELGTLTFKAKGKGSITVRVGETPEESLERDDKKLEQYPLSPVVLSENDSTFILPERAFRYVSLECDKGADISAISFDASMWPVEYQMQFETDDEYVNNLFEMSSATLHTSMHRFYLDGVKRDFLPWSMDALVSTVGGDYLFGDQQVSKNGISIALMPLNPQLSDVGIPDYPLHALFGLKQNYLRFGDITTSLQYKDRIVQLLDFYASIVDENGFVHGNYGDKQFGFTPGWSTANGPARKGIASYAQIMLYYNYETGAYFADLWKEKALADKYRKLAENLKKNIFDRFWDNERQVFINGTMNDGVTVDNRISHHAQYWGILADIFPVESYDNLFDNILPNLPKYYSSVSYEKGYEFLAYAKAGRIKEMWDYIYLVFGDWMDQGHTRFPENFLPEASRSRQLEFYRRPYGLSLCHGANGVPVVVGALNGLIGFSQSAEKPNEYTISPELLHLKWIHARIPVKEGFITMKINSVGESFINIPENCKVKVVTKGKTSVLKNSGEYKFTY